MVDVTPRQELLEGSEVAAREKCYRKEAEQHQQHETTCLEKIIVSTRGEWWRIRKDLSAFKNFRLLD